MTNAKETVVVAMSGGVDSTVCAALMAERYNVIGVTLQLYDYGKASCSTKTCCASKDLFDAQTAAAKLGIKHYTLNYEDIFRSEVIKEFADRYTQGYTPVPCIKCNQTVKFRDLFKIAKKLGASKLVTGHYVQKKQGRHGAEMHKGFDQKKDQSYFLFHTTQEQLDFLEFPLGHLTKNETREIARKYDLTISEKPDSQNICFVPDGNYASIVTKYHPNANSSGNIVDINTGEILGKHNGIINYTIGQRRRIGVTSPHPLYVCKLDAVQNIVYVGKFSNLLQDKFTISEPHFLLHEGEDLPKDLSVRVRSSCAETPCEISNNTITLKEKISIIAPGQAAVFYSGTRVIGGGWIESVVYN